VRPLFVLVILAGTTACQAALPTPAEPSLVAIPTADPPVGQVACMDALLAGQLAADPDAGVVVQAADGSTILVVWPHGWAAVDQDGMRILLNDHGDPIARVGDRVEIGGGQGPDGRWHTCGEVTRLP
jgi:hypothetical protein